MSERICIFGAGGLGREFVRPLRLTNPDAELVFIDDALTGDAGGVRVVPFAELCAGERYVLAVGDGHLRARLDARCLAAGLVPHTFVDVRSAVDELGMIDPGAVFCGFTGLTEPKRIGRQFQCNWYSYVAHDCVIGDFVTFAARVSCNGNVHIGDFAYIGTGAMLRQGTPDKPLRIGEGAVVGMGAVVTKDVPPHTTVVGNPARILERKVEAA